METPHYIEEALSVPLGIGRWWLSSVSSAARDLEDLIVTSGSVENARAAAGEADRRRDAFRAAVPQRAARGRSHPVAEMRAARGGRPPLLL